MPQSNEKSPQSERRGLREYRGWMGIFVTGLSALLPLYSIFYILNISGLYLGFLFFDTAFRALFLLAVLTLVFLLYPATQNAPMDRVPWYDILLMLIASAPTLYEFSVASKIAWGTKSGASGLEQLLFVVLMLVVFEGVRRVVGWPVLLIIMLSFVYAKFAYLMPGLWGTPLFSLERLAEYMYLYDTGIFGMILGVGATIVILFNTFGTFLVKAGTANLMMDGSLALVGRWRGGPAKVAVLGSAVMATVSGSPTANAGTTGAITIPLMKRLGYNAEFAAAVEAVASTGGLITPPIMGTIAFIMAEITGLGYGAVIVAAILPALLYYTCLFFQLDFEAAKSRLVGLPRDQLPSLQKALKDYWHLLLPIVVLLMLLIMRHEVMESIILCLAFTVVVSWFRRKTRMTFPKIVDALALSTRGILMVIVVMAAIGIVFGSVTLTGLAINLSTLIRDAAGGNLWLLAIFTWIVIYVSGMAVGEIVVYIVMAIIIVPAFIQMGVPVLAAHLFVFLTGVSMMITPPTCPVIYVTASMAGSQMWQTGFRAMRLAIVVFLVPFMVLFNPALILEGSPGEIVQVFVTCAIAAYFLAAGIVGYFLREASWWQRIFFIAGGVALFVPGWRTDLVGLPLVLIPTVVQLRIARRCMELPVP